MYASRENLKTVLKYTVNTYDRLTSEPGQTNKHFGRRIDVLSHYLNFEQKKLV